MKGHPVRRWPLFLIGAPAAVAIWSGWVGLGAMCGFGLIHPLPGILPRVVLNTAITLPVGVEAYGAYALGAWLAPGVPAAARRFARWSAVGSLLLGSLGQVAYHLLAAVRATRAPWPVIVAVSCVPVVALGFGAALTHLLRDATGDTETARVSLAAPILAALAARIAPLNAPLERPESAPSDAVPGATESATECATATPGPGVSSATEGDIERATSAPPETQEPATANATDPRHEPRHARRQIRATKVPAWHATARRAAARNPAITPEELRAKCGVSLRSAQRYLQDHPPTLHAVDTSAGR